VYFQLGGPKCGYQYDSAAFVYSLVNYPGWQPVKFDQKGLRGPDKKYSISTCTTPTFGTGGSGHDLAISSGGSGVANLGYTYGPVHGHTPKSSFAWTFLAGKSRFKADEVEVFYETT